MRYNTCTRRSLLLLPCHLVHIHTPLISPFCWTELYIYTPENKARGALCTMKRFTIYEFHTLAFLFFRLFGKASRLDTIQLYGYMILISLSIPGQAIQRPEPSSTAEYLLRLYTKHTVRIFHQKRGGRATTKNKQETKKSDIYTPTPTDRPVPGQRLHSQQDDQSRTQHLY